MSTDSGYTYKPQFTDTTTMSRKSRIEQQLTQELPLDFLQVENESGNHHVPEGSETHFKIIAVSAKFEQKSRIDRHKLLYNLLANELAAGLHALSLHLYTPEEWAAREQTTQQSPKCRDGFGH